MNDADINAAGQRRRRLAWAAGLLAVGALGGGLLALGLPASAEQTPGTYAAATAGPGQPRDGGGQRSDETLLTGTDAEKAKAAALQAVPGATIDRVETDADGAAYEAHVTKADGTRVTVKFDKAFNVTAVEEGMGKGRPKTAPSE
jgi:hypothetical protein